MIEYEPVLNGLSVFHIFLEIRTYHTQHLTKQTQCFGRNSDPLYKHDFDQRTKEERST